MNTKIISDIFNILQEKRIPLRHSVPFCLRLQGKKLSEISKAAGVTRGMLYQILAGKRRPNKRIRKELEISGINPWKE
jgi:hypothetical protein